MKALASWWRAEPAAITAVVTALVAALAIPDEWAKVLMAVLALLGGGAVRKTVWSPPSHEQALAATRGAGPPGGSSG